MPSAEAGRQCDWSREWDWIQQQEQESVRKFAAAPNSRHVFSSSTLPFLTFYGSTLPLTHCLLFCLTQGNPKFLTHMYLGHSGIKFT